MKSLSAHYPDLVKMLVYRHGHSDAPKPKFTVQKALTNGLDFDEAAAVMEHASQDLEFVHMLNGEIWYVQEREVLVYIRDETAMDLSIISDKFDHLKPPELREEFNL
ncbi:hypothetical protein B4589_015565 (plasmid) [Halolamina sp. CBA1230]|uniref:hypothetical protein n=1 Tax=Halolamina sp. CBA1230 TaxID=1853690 RepID=UPI00117A8161|nr:hypothetical protein [Halolamina sp. CBA1230]QKY21837.1 hypothetical protein B4589_015565 [Halolamina sp. CBA1230]